MIASRVESWNFHRSELSIIATSLLFVLCFVKQIRLNNEIWCNYVSMAVYDKQSEEFLNLIQLHQFISCDVPGGVVYMVHYSSQFIEGKHYKEILRRILFCQQHIFDFWAYWGAPMIRIIDFWLKHYFHLNRFKIRNLFDIIVGWNTNISS